MRLFVRFENLDVKTICTLAAGRESSVKLDRTIKGIDDRGKYA